MEFVVLSVGKDERARTGVFVECETDKGVVAIWGRPSMRDNMISVQRALPPFRLSTSHRTKPNSHFPQHHHWIPDYSKIQISKIEEEATTPHRS